MERRTRTAREHGTLAGRPFAEDDGRRLTVTPEVTVTGPRQFRYEVHLTSNVDPEAKTVYFDVDSPFDVDPPALADVALLVSVFPAMTHGGELRLEGEVSEVLARNVRELQAIWTQARPDLFRPFRLDANRVVPDVGPVNTKAIMPLSGGLDSMLSLANHTDPERPLDEATCELGACLFIPGLSPRLHLRDEFPAAIDRVRTIASRRDIPLAVAESNYGTIVKHGSWAHGALLAAAVTLFSSRFGIGMIAASLPYVHPFYRYWGSSASGDPFFSSGAMEIRNHGTDLYREEKAAALCHYPELLDDLVVCFEVKGLVGNCGRCEKCMRTMTSFLAIDEEIPAKAFPTGIDVSRIGKRLGLHTSWAYVENTLRTAKAMGVKHPVIAKLKRKYLVKRVKFAMRYATTWALPWVNMLGRDAWAPVWLVNRKTSAAKKAPREPWYKT